MVLLLLVSAGEAVGSKMAEKQKEMVVVQRENQKQMMMEQMKKQLSMQMAAQREQLNWEFGTFGFFGSVLVLAKMSKKHVPAPAAIPFLLASVIMAYQVDFAYGNKMDRVKKEADKILASDILFYVPFLGLAGD